MGIEILTADFMLGVVDPAGRVVPNIDKPEIAVVGRSNVGKSSFINVVLGRSGLARVSSTPGHTRQVNIYGVKLAQHGKRREITLADLPGFGYAKLSKQERESISRMTVEYIQNTPGLRVVALLVDSKRIPERDEGAIVSLCAERGVHVVVVATKIDRLTQKERADACRGIAKALGLEPQDVLTSGVGKFTARESFWSRVMPLVD